MSVSAGPGDCLLHRCSCAYLQAEDGIRDLVRSRGLGDVYKRQVYIRGKTGDGRHAGGVALCVSQQFFAIGGKQLQVCLLYTSDAADERSSVDLGGRRILKKKKTTNHDS